MVSWESNLDLCLMAKDKGVPTISLQNKHSAGHTVGVSSRVDAGL